MDEEEETGGGGSYYRCRKEDELVEEVSSLLVTTCVTLEWLRTRRSGERGTITMAGEKTGEVSFFLLLNFDI